MGLWRKKVVVPMSPVEQWTAQDVKAWAKSINLPKNCRTALKPISGKVLLGMTTDDFCALFDRKPAAIYISLFQDNLRRLAQGHGVEDKDGLAIWSERSHMAGSDRFTQPSVSGMTSTTMRSTSTSPDPASRASFQHSTAKKVPFQAAPVDKTDHARAIPDGGQPYYAHSENMPVNVPPQQPGFQEIYPNGSHLQSVAEAAAAVAGGRTPVQAGVTQFGGPECAVQPADAGAAARAGTDDTAWSMGPQQYAAKLRALTDNALDHDDLVAFLERFDRVKDMVDLCEGSPAAGGVFVSLLQAYQAAEHVHCISQTALHFQEFCDAVVQAMCLAGRKKAALCAETAEAVEAGFAEASALLTNFSRKGWLLHMAFMDNVKGRFDRAQDEVVDALQSAGVSELPAGKMLHKGDYSDFTRALRRVLKQIGRGSVADGMANLAASSQYQSNIATVLDVDPALLNEELAGLPTAASEDGTSAGELIMRMYGHLSAASVGGVQGEVVNQEASQEGAQLFERCDQGSKGFLDLQDFQRALSQIGMLETVAQKDSWVSSQFVLADRQQAGVLAPADFNLYYSSVVTGERHQLRSKLGASAEADLKQQFLTFANFGIHTAAVTEMDGQHFAKYCGDCGLVCKQLSRTDVDLTFAKVKGKGSRRISFVQFLKALHILADKLGEEFAVTVERCLRVAEPRSTSTRAQAVRLHDDKSTYTGVYARGGPESSDTPRDLAYILSRGTRADSSGTPGGSRSVPLARTGTTPHRHTSDAAARSVCAMDAALETATSDAAALATALSAPANTAALNTTPPLRRRSSKGNLASAHTPASVRAVQEFDGLDALERVFIMYALFAKGQVGTVDPADVRMDSKGFVKLLKDSGTMDGSKLNLTRVDLCFAKAAEKVTKRMNMEQFRQGLEHCADAKGVSLEAFLATIEECEPVVHGTRALPVKWFDDASLHTGVYAHGGKIDRRVSLAPQAPE